jgi:hypothetical protein
VTDSTCTHITNQATGKETWQEAITRLINSFESSVVMLLIFTPYAGINLISRVVIDLSLGDEKMHLCRTRHLFSLLFLQKGIDKFEYHRQHLGPFAFCED